MKTIFLIGSLFFISLKANRLLARQEPAHCYHISSVAAACSWKIVAEQGTISGTVIRFYKAPGRCGYEYVGAVAFIKTGGDTIRLIIPCYRGKLQIGRKINVHITKIAEADIFLPHAGAWGKSGHSKGELAYSVDEYDDVLKKTVFGYPSVGE